jgi:hypothetical protein
MFKTIEEARKYCRKFQEGDTHVQIPIWKYNSWTSKDYNPETDSFEVPDECAILVDLPIEKGYFEQESGGPDEEGFSNRCEEIFCYMDSPDGAGITVYSKVSYYSRDCDGPHEHHWEGYMNLDTLEWETASRHQRDYFAEDMNY